MIRMDIMHPVSNNQIRGIFVHSFFYRLNNTRVIRNIFVWKIENLNLGSVDIPKRVALVQ